MALTVCSDLSPAGWLHEAPSQHLVTLGPSGFAAYARLRFLPDPQFPGQRVNDVPLTEDVPAESEQIQAVLRVLARHTSAADDCYVCLWDGWGWDVLGTAGDWTLHRDLLSGRPDDFSLPGPAWPEAVPAAVPEAAVPAGPPRAPKLVLPDRAYYLFHGALADVGTWSGARTGSFPHIGLPDPAFVWPADRAWCLTNDVDPHWAGIGCSMSAVADLLAEPSLDVVPADPEVVQPYYF